MQEKLLIAAGLVTCFFLMGLTSAKADPFEGVAHKTFSFGSKQIGSCNREWATLYLLPEGRGVFQAHITSPILPSYWNVKALTFKDGFGNRLLTLGDFHSPKIDAFGFTQDLLSRKTTWTFEFGFVSAYYDKVHAISFGNECITPNPFR